MARRSSPAEDLLDLVARLPWWAGIVLAVASYVLLHQVAVSPTAAVSRPDQMGAAITQTFWRGLAMAGQYALPIICLAGAGVSAWRRRTRQALVADVAQSKAADALEGMSWSEFEQLVGEAFRLQGYQVSEKGGARPDGGFDLVLRRSGEKFLVQCKQWRAYRVGVDVVRELFGVMAATGATGGFVVTSGRFTEEATRFADGRNVTLVDGRALNKLIRQAMARDVLRPASTSSNASVSAGGEAAAVCPICGSGMVRRTAKRGPDAGREFWGCSRYPACRGTRPIG